MRQPLAIALAAILVIVFAWIVWPTPYRYFSIESAAGHQTVMRVHRLTGNVEVFRLSASGGGWITQ